MKVVEARLHSSCGTESASEQANLEVEMDSLVELLLQATKYIKCIFRPSSCLVHFHAVYLGFCIYLLCALMLVILGAVDDASDVPARFRLWAQVVLGALLSYGSGTYLTTFGNLFGFGVIELFWLGPALAVTIMMALFAGYNWAIQHAWRVVVLFRQNQDPVDQES